MDEERYQRQSLDAMERIADALERIANALEGKSVNDDPEIPPMNPRSHYWEGHIIGDDQPRRERWECSECGEVIGPMEYPKARAEMLRRKGLCTGGEKDDG